MLRSTYLMGRWAMSSENSYRGPFERVDAVEDASSVKSKEEEDPREFSESSKEKDSADMVSLLSSAPPMISH